MTRRGRWVLATALLLGASFAAALTVDSINWRARVVMLKLTGDIPELGWIELARMLNPSVPYYIEDVARRRSGFGGGPQSV